jgi:hypothetical protein
MWCYCRPPIPPPASCALVLDRVYVRAEMVGRGFTRWLLPAPTQAEVAEVARRTGERSVRQHWHVLEIDASDYDELLDRVVCHPTIAKRLQRFPSWARRWRLRLQPRRMSSLPPRFLLLTVPGWMA